MTHAPRSRTLVCLTGFMGSGKSTAGRLLARQLAWLHIDLDKRITDAAGLAIPEIFDRLGEPEFRRMEQEQLARVLAESAEQPQPRIVSLGAGTIVQAQNLALLRESGAVLIWLDCPMEELLAALRPNHRPPALPGRSQLPASLRGTAAMVRAGGLPRG